jgi:hypothetical protein
VDSSVLLKKLIVLERSIGTADNARLRDLVYDAQDYLLQMQKEYADSFFAEAWRAGVSELEWLRKAS